MKYRPLSPEEFAFALRAHRQRLHLSQAGLAALLDVSKSVLEKWERGQRCPIALTMEGAIARLSAAASEPAAS